jgi:iron complex outermembrane receptor protein
MMATFYPSDKRKISLNALHYDGKFELPGALTKAEYEVNPRQAQAFAAKSDNRVSNKSTAFAVSQHYDVNSKLQNITSASLIFNLMDHPWGSSSFYNGYTISTSQGIAIRSRMVYSPKIGKIQSRFVAGGEYQTSFELEKEYQNVLGQPGDLQGDYEFKSTQSILFAQSEFDLPYQFLITFGASFNNTKYDYINRLIPDSLNPRLKIAFDPAISPRVALLKKFNDNKSVFASVSYGFSPPTQYEVQTQAGVNPGLKPEHGWNYEIGTRGNVLKSRFNYDVVAYYFHLKNAILPRINAADQEYFENSGSTNQYGVEAVLSYVIASNSEKTISLLKPWISYTYNHYRFRNYRKESYNWVTSSVTVFDYSGKKVTGIAPNIIAAGMDVESKYGFYFNLTYNFFDAIPLTDDNSIFVKSYSVMHSRLGFRKIFFKHLATDIYYGLNNITDEKYNNVLSLNATGGRYYNPAAGRNYFTGVSLKYIL